MTTFREVLEIHNIYWVFHKWDKKKLWFVVKFVYQILNLTGDHVVQEARSQGCSLTHTQQCHLCNSELSPTKTKISRNLHQTKIKFYNYLTISDSWYY